MPEKHFIITTKTDAAAAAVEQLLAELRDSIDVQQTPESENIELDAATLKMLDERLKEAETAGGTPWREVMHRIREKMDRQQDV